MSAAHETEKPLSYLPMGGNTLQHPQHYNKSPVRQATQGLECVVVSYNNLQQNDKIPLSVCQNGVKDTALTIWNATPISLAKRLNTCAVGDKDGAYFIRCTGSKRTNSDTADNASILILDGDKRIDTDTGEVVEGAPDPIDVSKALQALGINHLFFSSYSNGKEGDDFHKYRVVIPASYTRSQLPILLDYIHELLHDAGIMLFNVPENRSWAQAWYFPRCPQDRIHLFNSYHYFDGAYLDATQICDAYQSKHPAPIEPPAAKSEPARLTSAQNRLDPIRLFNEYWKSPVNYLLTQGYKPKGNRLLHPLSQSKIAGVQICKSCNDGVERIYSHGSDVLNDGYAHDAFDCFVILEHGGNFTGALLDIARSWKVNGVSIETFNRMTYQGGRQ